MSGPDPRLSQAIDRYRIESLLGKGGMGEVYKAFDPVLDRTVALKTISSTSDDPQLLQRLYAEARACGRLSHPNIVQVYDLHESSRAVYISMEYLEGESLSSALLLGRLSLGDKLRILDQILAALQYAHTKGVIHRDVKPSNIHVLPDGHIKLLDFGLARIAVGPTMTVAGAVMGTAPYMSPEQLKAQVVDSRTDIYSTGVLAYEMFTGRRAFDGEHITAVMLKVLQESPVPIDAAGLGIPPEIAQVITRAMSKSPGDRYQNADEMRGALAACAKLSPALNGALQATVIAGPQSTVIASPQSTLTQVIPGRQSPLDSTIDEYGRAIPADPMRVLDGAAARSRPSDVKTTIANASFAEQMMAWVSGPRVRSWVGIAVLLLAFSIVWAITQLFLSPGTSASVTPADSSVSAPVAPPEAPVSRPPDSQPVAETPQPVPPPSDSQRTPIDIPPSGGNDSRVPGAREPGPSRPDSQASPSSASGAGSSQVPPPNPVGSSRQGAPGQTPTSRRNLTVSAANNDLSRALAERVRESLRNAGISPTDALTVSLEMSTRPSPFAGTNAITADYVGSVRSGGVTHRVQGNVLGFGEATLRNDVIERAATEIVAALSGTSPDR